MPQQINVQLTLLPKGSMTRGLVVLSLMLASASPAVAQRLSSVGVAVGAVTQRDVEATAVFNGSASVSWGWDWLIVLQTSVANLQADPAPGTQRDLSLSLLLESDVLGDKLLLGTGLSLHRVQRDFVNASDDRDVRLYNTVLLGLSLPIAGPGVQLEFAYRGDLPLVGGGPFRHGGLLGFRYQPGLRHTLTRGEPQPERVVAERAAGWNDVLMQLILLQQGLESFARIREIENGIELEFDRSVVTLYDDVAKAARVLAAADPPVTITVFAPNAGRVGAAVTAGSFPAERLRLQPSERVFLRVEH